MKTSKLVAGILMIVLSIFIIFQSGMAGIGNALSQNGQSSGTAGVLLAIMYLASGIVYLATRKKQGLGGDIACMVMLLIAGMMGFSAGSYSDLVIWAWLAVIIGVGFFIWHYVANRKAKQGTENKK
jgi:4-hydroxybenzoate polyprenyltransferase